MFFKVEATSTYLFWMMKFCINDSAQRKNSQFLLISHDILLDLATFWLILDHSVLRYKRFGAGGYFLMRRTFVIYKDATSSLPNLHQGVQESWPKQAQVSYFNTNILSSQKFQSSNPTTLIFDKTQSSSIQKWLSTLRRVERGVSSSTSICCRPQDMNHVSLTPKRWIPGEILSFMKLLKWWNVCVCACGVCVWCMWMRADVFWSGVAL